MGWDELRKKFAGAWRTTLLSSPHVTQHPQIAHFDDHNQPPFAYHDAHLTFTVSSGLYTFSAITHQILNKATFEQSHLWRHDDDATF